ncbi:MAG TPA: sulfurtransferase TusA family protein [Nocardioidaceae bacterium]|nr:sulfurtransferase TusA family protein [Nocardioidaceae bacterium]
MTTDSPIAVLDCTGMRCPLPVIRLAQAVRGQSPGAVVRLLADDPAALADVPAWCRMRDHELVSVDHGADGVATFDVRAGGS